MILNCGVGEDSWESLEQQEDQPVHPKRNQSWVFIGRTNVEVETPILWPPDVKKWLIGKAPDAGKDWRQEKGTTEDEMVGWHHRLNGHQYEQTPGVGDGQGGLACCCPWGGNDSDMTEWLNWTDWQWKMLQGTSTPKMRQMNTLVYPCRSSCPAAFKLQVTGKNKSDSILDLFLVL